MSQTLVSTALLAAVIVAAGAAAAPTPPATSFDIAITVDDVPAHGALTPGMTRVEIARTYIAALKAHKVPEAYGFVNAVHLVNEPENEGALKE